MTRTDFVDWLAGIFRTGKLKATAQDGQSSTTAIVDAGEGGQFPGQEVFGLASVLERPQDGAECVFVDIGDERIVVATKDRRWQIPLAAGEVVVRAMGPGSPAYVKLKPDGTAEVHATRIDLGGENLSNFIARADRVITQLNTLKSAISGASVVAADGGASLKASIMVALSAWPGSVSSDKVRGQ